MVSNEILYYILAFNLKIIDEVIDVYFAKTISYNQCERESEQKDMANTAPVKDMVKTKLKYIFILFTVKRNIICG